MVFAIFLGLATILLAIDVLRRRSVEIASSHMLAIWSLRGALFMMAAIVAFWLFFGFGELLSGEYSGVMHLVPAVMIVLLAVLARRRPFDGGIVLVILGALVSLYYFTSTRAGFVFQLQAALITGAPLLITGLLFLAAAAPARSKR